MGLRAHRNSIDDTSSVTLTGTFAGGSTAAVIDGTSDYVGGASALG